MRELLISLITTSAIMVVDITFSSLRAFWRYFVYFLMSLATLWALSDKAQAIEIAPGVFAFDLNKYEGTLSPNERARYVDAINYNEQQAIACYDQAKIKCWWLPDLSDRNRAQYCFNSFMATLAASTPMSKCIHALISMLTNYGLDCLYEWNNINQLLLRSQYHYEMKEFYETVLIKG